MANSATTQSKTITSGQMGQISDRLTTKLRESGLSFEGTQRALMVPGGAAIDAMVAAFRTHVDAMSEIIVRRAKVNRDRTPQEVVDATGRKQYINKEVLATLPKGEGDEVDVYFVPTKRYVPVAEVPAFLAQYGLVPDPRAQAAVNEADPSFADTYPNGSQWGNNCCLAFRRWDGGRDVYCDRYDRVWHDGWWLAGVLAPGT